MAITLDPQDESQKYYQGLYEIMISQDNAIEKELNKAKTKVRDIVISNSRDGEIKSEKKINSAINDLILATLTSIALIMTKYNNKLTTYQVNETAKTLKGKEKKDFLKSNKTLPTKIEKSVINRKIADKNTNQRFKSIYSSAQKTVKNIIAVGIKEGKDAFEIAKNIQYYIKPTAKGKKVSPYQFYREMTGKTTIPKTLRSGSVEYNALRIARTEIATTMRENIVYMYKDFTGLVGYQWILSASHPRPDICDLYAAHNEGLGIGIWRDPPGTPHPNCMCKLQPIIK